MPTSTRMLAAVCSGEANWVQINLEKDDHDHLFSPEERFRIAMAQQRVRAESVTACDALRHPTTECGDVQARTSSTGFTGTIRATRFMTFLFCSAFFRS